MELNIGKSIRRLRNENNITQEELATTIGVSAQAVSKWERNEGYPDITLLPEISAFFGVSLDTLCGIDEERDRRDISAIHDRIHNALTYDERVSAARNGVKKYPYSCELKADLADALAGCLGRWTPPKETLLEIISLYEEILDHSTDQNLKISVLYRLSRIYELAGYHKKAEECTMNLPDYCHSWEFALTDILHGDELVDHVQNRIISIIPTADYMICRMLDTDWYSPEEKIRICEKMIAVYELTAEFHEWSVGLIWSMMKYQKIAVYRMDIGNPDGCIAALSKAAELAEQADAQVFEGKAKSLMINSIDLKWFKGEANNRRSLLNDMESENKFDAIRERDDYKAIVSRLTN